MPLTITEQQVYEDLSTCLLLVKRKLALFIKRQEQHQAIPHAPATSIDEETIRGQLDEMIKKYKSASITTHEIVNIVSRFMYRIREIVGHITGSLPKHRVYLQVAIRKIELFTLRVINHQNYALTISSLLQIVNNVTQGHQLVISRTTHHKNQEKHQQEVNQVQSIDRYDKPKERGSFSEVSEVNQMLMNADKYNIMDFDREQFRARYFDLKEDEQKVRNDILNRNRYIKQVIQSYERDYMRFKSKPPSMLDSNEKPRFIRRKSEQKVNKDMKQKIVPESNLMGTTRKRFKDSHFNKNQFNKTFHTIDHGSLERKMGPDTFRSIYEQKLNQKKNYAVKVKNMVMIDKEQTISIHSKDANTKKIEFFKKSQEHLRYRYKYYYYKDKNTSSNSIKYKTFNPETTFNITLYK